MQTDTQIWQEWLEWLPTAPPVDKVVPIFGLYRSKLLGAGASEAETDQQIATIRRMMRTETGGWQVLFNNIYSSPSPGFSTQPNALLVSAAQGRTAGQALDVSTGQGRNAVFLAMQGWEVTGVDISDQGLKVAQDQAGRAGVQIRTVLQSNDLFDFGSEAWDLIVVTYVPISIALPEYIKRIHQALRPGGLLVVESFASDTAAQNRRPVDIDPEELKRAVDGFSILHFSDLVALPDWDDKEARLVRLIAEKKQ